MTNRFLVLGCGHTGTTLLSGIFHISGFNSMKINANYESKPFLEINKKLYDGRGDKVYPELMEYFRTLEQKTKGQWCIKDPRLSLTIHEIYPILSNPIKVLYNFRDPRPTVRHLLKERERWCPGMSPAQALKDAEDEYYERNRSTLDFLDSHPEIEYIMVNYDDLIDGKLQRMIDRFVGTPLNYEFIQPNKRKSPPIDVDDRCMRQYDKLMDRYISNLGACVLNTESYKPGPAEILFQKLEYKLYLLTKLIRHLGKSFKAKQRELLSRIRKRFKRIFLSVPREEDPGSYSTLDCKIKKVPVQMAAYNLARDNYIQAGDLVLDVGFGLGNGLKIMSERDASLCGIEIDKNAVRKGTKILLGEKHGIRELKYYDGKNIPYADQSFDIVTCIDVLEHVLDYENLIDEMLRVSKRVVFISTPNRRPEYTQADGKPKNRWHLREWSYEELDAILDEISGIEVEWNFLNSDWDGPFVRSPCMSEDTMALTPALLVSEEI